MGPIQLIPHQGSGWAPEKKPERLRATYNDKSGVRYLYGAYNIHADRLHGRLRPRKGEHEVIGFFSQIRIRYDPRLRIYLVQDNLSCHWTPKVREWASRSNLELVPTPTYASYLNRDRVPLLGARLSLTSVRSPSGSYSKPRDLPCGSVSEVIRPSLS